MKKQIKPVEKKERKTGKTVNYTITLSIRTKEDNEKPLIQAIQTLSNHLKIEGIRHNIDFIKFEDVKNR